MYQQPGYRMPKHRVAIASSSALAAQAGVEVAEKGGNAVDAAVAASLVQLVTEPGVVSLAAGAFIIVWRAGERPTMIDGASEMPGRAVAPSQRGSGGIDVMLPYGGGTPSTVGYGSVATPGVIAGYDLATRRYGSVPWADLVAPAARVARQGFPLLSASARYLDHTHEGIFGWNPPALAPLLRADGSLVQAGDTLHLPELAGTLEILGREGADSFYRGELARRMAEHVEGNGGILGLADLEAYTAREVAALEVVVDDWHLATAPAPSVGGATAAAMLLLMRGMDKGGWTPENTSRLIDAQSAVLEFRERHMDQAEALDEAVAELLRTVGEAPGALQSPSTVHTSTVDESGLACAITASAGYGAGVLIPGTGIWMNNSLGEAELNRRGFHVQAPGTRLPSNMAPTAGRSDRGDVLAIGSPGADRITTAIVQTLLNFAHLDMPLQAAADHPRLHVERTREGPLRVAFEPGLPVDQLPVVQRRFDGLDMFFGGVGAVHLAADGSFELAADVRRTGGMVVSGDSTCGGE